MSTTVPLGGAGTGRRCNMPSAFILSTRTSMCGPTNFTASVRCRFTHSQLVGACRFHMWGGMGTAPVFPSPLSAVRGVRGAPFWLSVGGLISTGEKSEPSASPSWTVLGACVRAVTACSRQSASSASATVSTMTSWRRERMTGAAPPFVESASVARSAACMRSGVRRARVGLCWWHRQRVPFLEPAAFPRRCDQIPTVWVCV
mmetsp:Transcript_72736/g.122488  ORF Transcript_72736/g.122488 Transcript_72736/m.122488 type:complete len:202 (-) Transcript_72736:140-745(-)